MLSRPPPSRCGLQARRERAERSHEPPEQRSLEELDLRHAAERARIEREREREAVESRQVVRAEDPAATCSRPRTRGRKASLASGLPTAASTRKSARPRVRAVRR
jgi:hypothetical protein